MKLPPVYDGGADVNTSGGGFPLMREGFEARFHELGLDCCAACHSLCVIMM